MFLTLLFLTDTVLFKLGIFRFSTASAADTGYTEHEAINKMSSLV